MYTKTKTDGHYKTGDTVRLKPITVNTTAKFKLTIFKKGKFYAYQGKVIKQDLACGYKTGEVYGLPCGSFYKA